MLRPLLSSAAAVLRCLSSRSSAGWAPPRHAEVPALSRLKTAVAPEFHEGESGPKAATAKKFNVICQNWQRFGSCRYGERCAFAAGHVERATMKARLTRKRRGIKSIISVCLFEQRSFVLFQSIPHFMMFGSCSLRATLQDFVQRKYFTHLQRPPLKLHRCSSHSSAHARALKEQHTR
jgi:hypothetical protein